MRLVVSPWCHNIKFALQAFVIVVPDIGLYHLDKFIPARELAPIVALTLQHTPKAFHRPVVYAVTDAGHTLRHAMLHELRMERAVRILEASVTVEQRMCSRVLGHCFVKRVEYDPVVVAVAQLERHDPVVA